jgi:hypothetical protein
MEDPPVYDQADVACLRVRPIRPRKREQQGSSICRPLRRFERDLKAMRRQRVLSTGQSRTCSLRIRTGLKDAVTWLSAAVVEFHKMLG